MNLPSTPIGAFTIRHRTPIVFLVAVVAGVLTALGFGLYTPDSRIRAVATDVRSLDHRVASVESAQAAMVPLIRSLAREKCITLSPHDWQMLGLPCYDLLDGQRP